MTIRITLTLAALLIGAAQAKAEEASWHLLTKSRGGAVSLLKGLTEYECEKARNRLFPVVAECVNCTIAVTDDMIVYSECFQ